MTREADADRADVTQSAESAKIARNDLSAAAASANTPPADTESDDLDVGDSCAPQLAPDGYTPAVHVPVICGVGPGAQDIAELVAGRCGRRVRTKVTFIDKYAKASIEGVGMVVVVLSSETHAKSKPRFRELRQVGEDFREMRPIRAADAFYPGTTRAHRAGVLVVLYPSEALHNEDARALIADACASYCYTPGMPFSDDLFEVYQSGIAQIRREKDQVEADMLGNWALLNAWGILDVEFARLIKSAIDERCAMLHDPSKPVMSKPIAGEAMNRLELVLFAPNRRPEPDPTRTPEQQKKDNTNFVASGARAVRDHLDELEATHNTAPMSFRRPNWLRDRKDQQAAYRKLYQVLRTVIADS